MKRKTLGAMLLSLLAAIIAWPPATGAQATVRAPAVFMTVASGLDNPRGLLFGPDGTLYVAEAGRGGDGACMIGPEGQVCLGQTGAVVEIKDGVQRRLVDDLYSLAQPQDGSRAIGAHDLALGPDGELRVLVGLGANPAVRAGNGPLGEDGINFGQLVGLPVEDDWRNLVDVAAYESGANPDGGFIDSNPYGLTAVADGYLIADAGANALLHVTEAGDISTVAVFPDVLVDDPSGSGMKIPMQAVPTSVVVGPDGAYYVGQLTGYPFPVGGAAVFRVAPGEEPEVYADGFSAVIDLAFDDDGNLYVLEMFANGLLSGDPSGAVTQIAPDGTRRIIAKDGLVMPGGMAVGPDGALYISNYSGMCDGQVVKVLIRPTIYLPLLALR